jgi:hypothetical protein
VSPALIIWACLARTVTGAVDTGYVLELKGEVRERTLSYPESEPSSFQEVWLQPILVLELAGHLLEGAVDYRPEFTFYDQVGQEFAVLQRASLTGRLRMGPQWRLTGSAIGSYGDASSIQIAYSGPQAPPGTPPTSIQPVPLVSYIKYVNGVATLGVEGVLTPTVQLRTSAEVFVDGGADAAAEAQWPLEWGGRLLGGVDWTASARSLLRSEIRLSKTRLESGWGAFIGLATETWRFSATRQTTLSVGAGLSYASSRNQGQSVDEVRPWGLLGLAWESGNEGSRFRTSTTIASEPEVDRWTGMVANRLTAGTVNTLTIDPRWRFDVFGSGGMLTDGPQAHDTNWSAEGRAVWVGGTSWEVYLGGRAVWSRYAQADTRSYDWSAFLGVSLRQTDRPPDRPSVIGGAAD